MKIDNKMEELFRLRPFKTRNADEYDTSNILSLFVNPIEGLSSPFDFENSIIKGRMGSGKTMYLRANHACYLSGLVPSIIEQSDELILPVLIRLNDFQHITEPQETYRAIIIKIIEELTSIYLHLEDMKNLAALQSGIRYIPNGMLRAHKFSNSMKQLALLGSEEYIERISTEFGVKTGVKPKFFELSANWKTNNFSEVKKKPNPGIKDIEECYKTLLEDQDGKILLLIDEAGSLDPKFFRSKESTTCFFEILMNQFRTASFIRTKIAVYPNSYSDILTETRYGDTVLLEDKFDTETNYMRFRNRTIDIIRNYLNPNSHEAIRHQPNEIFDIVDDAAYGDSLEQLMYASGGNMRRLIQLLDLVMDVAYTENNNPQLITTEHAFKAMNRHASNTELHLNDQDKEFLSNLIQVCKSRKAFIFKFPNVPLYKYTNRSHEYNLINVEEVGTGRRATTYSFDYAYCVLKDIPTHLQLESDTKTSVDRNLKTGRWIQKVTTINQELLEHAALPGKLEGKIDYVADENSGFIMSDANEQYYFWRDMIIEMDREKQIINQKRVRFHPTNLGDSKVAANIEMV